MNKGREKKKGEKYDPETTAKLNRKGMFSCRYSASRPKEEKPMDTPKKRKKEEYQVSLLDAVKTKYLMILDKIATGEGAPLEMIKPLKKAMTNGILFTNGKNTIRLPVESCKGIPLIYQDITEKMLDGGYINELAKLGEDDLLANGAVCHRNESVAMEAARIIVRHYPEKREDIDFLITSNHESVQKMAAEKLASVANTHHDAKIAAWAVETLKKLLNGENKKIKEIVENAIKNIKRDK